MLLEIEQKSQPWYELRKNRIGGSDAASVLGFNPWKSREKLMQQKLGLVPEDNFNAAMQKGVEMEPIARDKYQEITSNLMRPTVHIHDEYDWAMCSTDGLRVCYDDIMLEIKCGKSASEQAKKGLIPHYYNIQLQHNLWVTNAQEAHYFVFWDNKWVLMKFEREEKFIEGLRIAEEEFYYEWQERAQILKQETLAV